MLDNNLNEILNKIEYNNKEILLSFIQPCLSIRVNTFQESYSSKIGGFPPVFEEYLTKIKTKNLTFLCQISLNELGSINSILPEKGHLLFFILVDNIGYRYPDRKGEFGVVFVENTDRIILNKSEKSIKEYPISFFKNHTLPSYQEYIIEKNNLTELELNLIEQIEFKINLLIDNDLDINHQVLGHPKAVQGTVKFWWAMKYLGFENVDILSRSEINLINQEEENFILLLQLNFGDPKIEIDYFGDSIAYFGIHKFDLQNKNFDNVVLVMQNS